ncbi:scavenger receptor class B member debris buster isoform X1 [Haematobia irritans]|uniref:scavenger receptor class B member debris buster isoform X1 n=1 Tax=Haematobia irritans TaxID=7368 RepID=UPI003F4FB3BA
MGLKKYYLRYGRSARDRIFHCLGIPPPMANGHNRGVITESLYPAEIIPTATTNTATRTTEPVQMRHHSQSTRQPFSRNRPTPWSMLISKGIKLSNNRLAVIIIGIITLILGILLTTIPWLDYFILKNLRLWNDTLSYHYWQRPGVIRLTKVYIYNVTNPDGFLSGEKPKLQEVGPFVYREDMQKVNVKFHDNFTVSYQHKKILEFVPELSIDKNTPIVTPNIPLLTLTSLSPKLGYVLSKTISVILTAAQFKPFINVTAEQLVFGYDDPLVTLAHKFYPKHLRPGERMGLLIARNGTLSEVSSIKTGYQGMHDFGYLDRLNGMDHFPQWDEQPCTGITGSEGSFFPPRSITKSDMVYVYDKDLCRVIPLKYEKGVEKDGIDADLFKLTENSYGDATNNPENKCYDTKDYKAIKGLQNISPCQYGAPVYLSNPHFFQADPELLETVEGLTPNADKHQTYFKIQPKLGVPLEGKVRIQLNLRVTQAKHIFPVKDFRNFIFPVMWLEEGISDLTPAIRRWIYLATVFAPTVIPIGSYLMIAGGAFAIIYIFLRAYQTYVFAHDPALEILEMGRRSLRRSSTFIAHHQHRFMHRDSYILLKNPSTTEVRMESTTTVTETEDIIPIINGHDVSS